MQSLPVTALLAVHLIVFFNPDCTTDIYNNNLIWWTQRDSNPHKLVERGHYPRLFCALENAPGARPLCVEGINVTYVTAFAVPTHF